MTKKILIIIISVLILAILGVLFIAAIGPSSEEIGSGNSGEGSGSGFIFGIFGGGGSDDGEGSDPNKPGIQIERPLLKLRKISETPTSGFVSFEEDEEVFVRYTERATGHIYEARTTQPTVKRVANTTIPRIYEAVWLNKDSSVIRYLDESDNIKSFYAEIAKNEEENSEEGKIEGIFLKDNLKKVIPYGEKILSVLFSSDDSIFALSDLDGSNSFEVFRHPAKEWIIQSPKTGILALTTKPTTHSLGYLFYLDINTKILDKVLGGIKGLTTLVDQSAEKILYAKNLDMFVLEIGDEEVENLRIKSLPEKCVWTKNSAIIYCGIPSEISSGEYPDDWYQGEASFSDDIYSIDIMGGDQENIISPEVFSGEEIDMIKPSLSPNEDFLFFINKKDLSLWSLDLRENKPIIVEGENEDIATTTATTTEEAL